MALEELLSVIGVAPWADLLPVSEEGWPTAVAAAAPFIAFGEAAPGD